MSTNLNPSIPFLSQVLEEDREFSDRDTDPEDSADFSGVWEREREEDEAAMGSDVSLTVRQAVSHLLPPALERSGRETPVSVDSIPLEWDHTVDVGGSSSPEDDEELTYYSALSGNFSLTGLCHVIKTYLMLSYGALIVFLKLISLSAALLEFISTRFLRFFCFVHISVCFLLFF